MEAAERQIVDQWHLFKNQKYEPHRFATLVEAKGIAGENRFGPEPLRRSGRAPADPRKATVDYYSIIAGAISTLPNCTTGARQAFYERARAAVAIQVNDDPTRSAREHVALEKAIRQVEAISSLRQRNHGNGQRFQPTSTLHLLISCIYLPAAWVRDCTSASLYWVARLPKSKTWIDASAAKIFRIGDRKFGGLSMTGLFASVQKNVGPQHVLFFGLFLMVAAFAWCVDTIGSVMFFLGFLLALGGGVRCALRAKERADLQSLDHHLTKLKRLYSAAARGERDRLGEASLTASDAFWIFRLLSVPVLFLAGSFAILLPNGPPLPVGLGMMAFAIYCSLRAFEGIRKTLELRRRRKAALENADRAVIEHLKLIDKSDAYVEEYLIRRGWAKVRP